MAILNCPYGHPPEDDYAATCAHGHDLVEVTSTNPPEPIRTEEGRRSDEVPPSTVPAGMGQVPTVVITVGVSRVKVTAREFTLGRRASRHSPMADVLLRYPNVSREHATVIVDANHFLIQDNASTNDTFIDGKGIRGTGPQRLPDRGTLRLARNCNITLTIVTAPARISERLR